MPISARAVAPANAMIFDYKGIIHGAYMTGLIAAEHVMDAV